MSPYQFIRSEVVESKATLWLNRPPVNVLNIPMMEEMLHALSDITSNERIRLLLLRGEGRCFSAGMDVAEHLPDKVWSMFEKMHALMLAVAGLEIPTISIIHGNTLGGGLELAVMSDFAYAVRGSKMGQPEINLGVFPPLAVAYFPELIGVRNAYDLILSGRTIDAQEALKIGLISDVLESTELDNRIENIASGLLCHSRTSLAMTKKALRQSVSNLAKRLTQAEEIYLDELMQTHDATEGLKAFLEKRQPSWRHR
jgi:cyclohexa-1,5-dienecarbonyl-CoA hydratase